MELKDYTTEELRSEIKRRNELVKEARMQEPRCRNCKHIPQNHQDSNRPSGGIVLEDFNGGEGFYKLNLAYLNKKQVEEVEEMVREWNNEPSTSEEDIKDCIGLCLTDADEQRFKNYHTNLRDCLAWLEKQGKEDKQHLYDIIVALWDLLDKIDTFSELKITDTNLDNPFRKIMHITDERFKYVKSDGYNLFIDDAKITNRKGLEEQCEENYIHEIGPKFNIGDWITNDEGHSYLIAAIDDDRYLFEIGGYTHEQSNWEYIDYIDSKFHLWTIEDAKDGDILVVFPPNVSEHIFIFKEIKGFSDTNVIDYYCELFNNNFRIKSEFAYMGDAIDNFVPATKEQRDKLKKAMADAGYEWDVKKKELKKIEQSNEESNEGNLEIEGLYHAKEILEKTLGKVEGYQTDDGILEHKSAITAVTKLCEQKPVEEINGNIEKVSPIWSEEDEKIMNELNSLIDTLFCKGGISSNLYKKYHNWLKSLKERLQP